MCEWCKVREFMTAFKLNSCKINRRLVRSYKRFIWWNSKPMVEIFRSNSAIFDGFQIISLTAYNIRPPFYLLQSHLKILKSFIRNYLSGKVLSSLDLEIRNIMKFSINPANISYLFREESILRWLIYTAWIAQMWIFDVSEIISS